MATIVVHGGDFRKSEGTYLFGMFILLTDKHPWLGEKLRDSELAEIEIVTEENKPRIMRTFGFGLAGLAVLGPLGAIGGMLVGGKKKTVMFAAKFRDGREFIGTTDAETFATLKGIAIRNRRSTSDDDSDDDDSENEPEIVEPEIVRFACPFCGKELKTAKGKSRGKCPSCKNKIKILDNE